MAKPSKGRLARLVTRLMKKQGLTQDEVAKRSRTNRNDPKTGIAASYISNIAGGRVTNLTTEKMNALARGLGVGLLEVFCASEGIVPGESSHSKSHELPDVLFVLELMEKVVVSPALMDILQAVAALSERKQAMVVRFVTDLNESRVGTRPGRKPRRKGTAN